MKNILQLLTAITRTDSYKMSQWVQYPKDTTHISSYIEARGGEPESVFFGLQAFIKEYMMNPITMADIDFAERVITAHGEPFNRKGWEIIVKEYGGMLPVEIEAVPEGTIMPTSNVQVQLVNTDPRLYWLTSYLETAILRGVWYPSTVATMSRKMKKVIAEALYKTSDIPVMDQLFFKLHDFGARGASSTETAVLGGMSHLVNFMGTDTFEGIMGAMTYYNSDVCGFSIPASEHSTITSWGSEGEIEAFKNMIEQFAGEGKIFACVSDSYDIYAAAGEKWPSLKEELVAKGGTLVVRPDSGDPLTMPIEIVKILMDKFGYTINSKGYKVLPPYIRVIQGDGIDHTSLPVIVENMIAEGLSLDNLAFGMGGGLLQKVDRDTLKYAMKASARRDANGVWHDVFKDPITDKGKTSKKGRLGLIYNCGLGNCGYHTVPKEVADEKGNVLRPIFRNGELLVEDDFETIRQRAQLREEEYILQEVERY
jgi:nicotinamide phosphoribosyltransferase